MAIVNTENIFGKDGFVWWIGVIEDRVNDPDKLGRVRVRIAGYHSDDLEVLPTDQLPWAIIMQPTTSAAISGKGSSPTNLLEGTWVIGFFLDSKEKQQPIIIGTFGGMTQKVPFCDQESTYEQTVFEGLAFEGAGTIAEDIVTNADGSPAIENVGGAGGIQITGGDMYDFDYWEIPNEVHMVETEAFQDPNKEYPKCSYKDKPDTNKLATADLADDDTPVYFKLQNRTEGIEVAFGGTWDEPEPAFCAEYPHNQVFETDAGHVIELDNTPGKERVHIYHKEGTYVEIDSNGTWVRKVIGDSFDIVNNNSHVYVEGAFELTTKGVTKILVQDDCDIQVNGMTNAEFAGGLKMKVGGDYELTVDGAFNMQVGDWSVIAGDVNMSTGDFAIDGGDIWLNSGVAAPTAPGAPEGAARGDDLVRPACELEPPEYLAVETEDYFVDEGAPGIDVLVIEEVARDFTVVDYVPPDAAAGAGGAV